MICIDERIIKRHLESVIKRTSNPKHIKMLNRIMSNVNSVKKQTSGCICDF